MKKLSCAALPILQQAHVAQPPVLIWTWLFSKPLFVRKVLYVALIMIGTVVAAHD